MVASYVLSNQVSWWSNLVHFSTPINIRPDAIGSKSSCMSDFGFTRKLSFEWAYDVKTTNSWWFVCYDEHGIISHYYFKGCTLYKTYYSVNKRYFTMSIDLMSDIRIDYSRKQALADDVCKTIFWWIKAHLQSEKQKWHTIYPAGPQIFNAFDTTPFDDVKVVILWQDPYHGQWQAHGLSFSVPQWIPQPPSLRNIYKEIEDDLDVNMSLQSDLTPRAKQWVFLLNAILTVRAHEPASHQKIGWQEFTDAVIQTISDRKEWIVFLLRGNFAQSKQVLIDHDKHHILTAPHPSPFSVHKWFFGCKHFSKTNEFLQQQGKEPINRKN